MSKRFLEMVRSHLQQTCPATNVLPSSKAVILASLNMAGQYVKLKRDFEAYRNEVVDSDERLRKKIEDFSRLR